MHAKVSFWSRVYLNDLQGSSHDKAEFSDAFSLAEDKVSRRRMNHVKIDSQSTKATIAGQSKGRTAVEHLSIQMHANIRSHVFGTNTEDSFLKKNTTKRYYPFSSLLSPSPLVKYLPQ